MITTNGDPSWGTAENSIQKFFAKLSKFPRSKTEFFTLKSYGDKYSIDKVRKWLSKFSNCFMIVKSPVGGNHYHGAYHAIKKPGQLNRGTKFTHHVIGNNDGKMRVVPEQKYAPIPHPSDDIPYQIGVLMMIVCESIRDNYGVHDNNIVARVKARCARRRAKKKLDFHMNEVNKYLLKNYLENSEPMYYDHLFIKIQ